MTIRIKAVGRHKNTAYVYKHGGSWCCSLANGINAGMSFAGLGQDEMAVKFALEDCQTPECALAVCKRYGSSSYEYSLV